jgi:hypothetical protein
MKIVIELVENSSIKQHEMIREDHLKELIREIEKDGFINNPIIVDKKTRVILDGHHRFNAIKFLGLALSPVYLCDYKSEDIKIGSWRKGEKVTKEMVIEAGLSGKLLEPKTSKHSIPNRPVGMRIPLKSLEGDGSREAALLYYK